MKKYAILGPRYRIFQVIEREEEPLAEHWAELTEEQATFIEENKDDHSNPLFLIDGEVVKAQEYLANRRWDDDAKEWVVFVPSVPARVERYKFLGQLAKEVIEGDDEQLKTAINNVDSVSTFLKGLIIQSELITSENKIISLNEIDEALSFVREHPFIGMMAPLFGYTNEEEIDDFFRRAVNYKFGQ